MKQLKFRIWDSKCKEFLEEEFYISLNGEVLLENEKWPTSHNQQFYKINQFTGISDKNGNEIYEGDIIKYIDKEDEWNGEYVGEVIPHTEEIVCYVIYYEINSNNNHLKYFPYLVGWKSKNYEIIGNIYENPELVGRRW